MQNPSQALGRDIHFTVDRAASEKLNQIGGRRYNIAETVPGKIVRVLDNNACNLMLFPDADEVLHLSAVPFSASAQPGTWTWPERMAGTQEAAA
ncbi:MAG: hypothetical protein JWO19_4439 [Bryobacterales bacterium]|nr:hypothetical protein [Bryobacterales bacterium]